MSVKAHVTFSHMNTDSAREMEVSISARQARSLTRRANSEIATFGALNAHVAADIAILQEFFSNRDRIMAQLFGRPLRRNPVRDELLRLIMLEFSQENQRRIAFYVRACSCHATAPSIRSELDLLVHADLIRLVDEPYDRRAKSVAPTTKLVSFYNERIPQLRKEVLSLIEQRL